MVAGDGIGSWGKFRPARKTRDGPELESRQIWLTDAEIILEEDLGGARVSGNARDACGAYSNETLNPPDLRE